VARPVKKGKELSKITTEAEHIIVEKCEPEFDLF
jgi:hypothetical protein